MPPPPAAISAASPARDRTVVALATEAVAHAHAVNDYARLAVRKATELVKTSTAMRRERWVWRRVWAELAIDPERVLAVCAYCQRVRSHQDEWGSIPARVRVFLGVTSSLTVTHGICPDCMAEHFPMVELALTLPR